MRMESLAVVFCALAVSFGFSGSSPNAFTPDQLK